MEFYDYSRFSGFRLRDGYSTTSRRTKKKCNVCDRTFSSDKKYFEHLTECQRKKRKKNK